MSIEQAITLHQAGRRAEAAAAYRAVLAREPAHAAALHAYGVLRHQEGASAEGAGLIVRALAAGLPGAEPHFNLGLALVAAGDLPAAEGAFRRALALRPDWPEPHYDLANALVALGRREEAIREFRAALRLRPDYVAAEVNCANALKALGRVEQAVAAYRRVLRAQPGLPEVQNNLGTALVLLRDEAGAEAAFRAALRLQPGFAEALGNLAALLSRAERFAEAVAVAEAACAARPEDASFHEMRGYALNAVKNYAAARAAYEAALALEPGRNTARFGMAETWRGERNGPAAEAILRDLVAALPGAWQAHHDLANVLRDQGKFAEAEDSYRAALALHENPVILKNLGAVLRDQQRLEEALPVLLRAASLAPKDEDIRYNLAVTQLSAGRLADGFALYDSRFGKFKVKPPPGRAWTGGAVRGRRILVATEQGLGDALHFVRYVPALAARGAEVVLLAPPALLRLLAGFPGVAQLVSRDDALPDYDLHCQLMSLPYLLKLPEPMPVAVPYVHAEAGAVAGWRGRLAALPGLRVGLVWAGNPGFTADHLRSVPVAALAPLGEIAGVSFVSLQKGAAARPDFLAADWTDALADMADTAALIGALDLVVSVDTGVAHLAGALGAPVWVMNRYDSCWRWLTARDDSIWYPTMRLFWQKTPGDWAGVVAELAAGLRARVHG